jgi:tripartite-type tricarboxylate transporter receptor subunit TctC
MHPSRRGYAGATLALAAVTLLAFSVSPAPTRAQDYPTHPIRLISDSGPGSAIDVAMRIIAEALGRTLGQQTVLINQPGAGGAIAARTAAQAVPDGYTFGMMALSAFVALPGSADNLPIHVPRDFTVVGSLGGAPLFITAAQWLGIATLPELIVLAKSKPGEIPYGSNGPGRLTNLTGELLQSRAGIKLLMVPYTGGTAQVLNDMMGHRVALTFDSYSGIAGAVEAKTVVPLAVASLKRLPLFPDVATAAETLGGFEANGWQVLLAPVGTPDAIVAKVNAALNQAQNDPDTVSRLAHLGREFTPLSSAQTLAFIQNEQKKWAPIIEQIGLTR